MLADEYPEYGILGPQSIGGTGMSIHLHVTNADVVAERAVTAGATVLRPLADQFMARVGDAARSFRARMDAWARDRASLP